jgi:hypothetical protein
MRFSKNPFLIVGLLFLLTFAAAKCASADGAKIQVFAVAPAKVEEMLQAASRLSRYPMPAKRPEVLVLTPEQFKVAAQGIPALGFFRPSQPHYIVLNGGMDADMGDTVMVHELVHFLQWAAGVLTVGELRCEDRRWIEQEAFVASYRFEVERGLEMHGLVLVNIKCPNDP